MSRVDVAERRAHPPSITAIVENDTIKLPPGGHVPDGTQARIVFETAGVHTLTERYAGLKPSAYIKQTDDFSA
jgi:hypothetical protein